MSDLCFGGGRPKYPSNESKSGSPLGLPGPRMQSPLQSLPSMKRLVQKRIADRERPQVFQVQSSKLHRSGQSPFQLRSGLFSSLKLSMCRIDLRTGENTAARKVRRPAAALLVSLARGVGREAWGVRFLRRGSFVFESFLEGSPSWKKRLSMRTCRWLCALVLVSRHNGLNPQQLQFWIEVSRSIYRSLQGYVMLCTSCQ